MANVASSSYGIDTNWYSDSDATDHITRNLDKIPVTDKYNGGDQIHTASGADMDIMHIGHSTIHTHDRDIVLKIFFMCLKLTRISFPFMNLHPIMTPLGNFIHLSFLSRIGNRGEFCLEADARVVCIHWSPFLPSSISVPLVPPSLWFRGGIVDSSIPRCLSFSSLLARITSLAPLKLTKLWFVMLVREQGAIGCLIIGHLVCQSFPFELEYSDVWVLEPTSIGRKNYCVSFIDDYSNYTWIYLLKDRSEVFQKFHEFQSLVERLLGRKIITMQTDWANTKG
jgi:hypothetical protein